MKVHIDTAYCHYKNSGTIVATLVELAAAWYAGTACSVCERAARRRSVGTGVWDKALREYNATRA